MGKRGPGSSKVTILETPNIKRPLPIKGMSPASRIVWKRLASAYPADYFKPQHYGQLRMYCESEQINKFARAKAALDGYSNPYWLNLADKMAGRCQGLAVKLNLTRRAGFQTSNHIQQGRFTCPRGTEQCHKLSRGYGKGERSQLFFRAVGVELTLE